MTIGKVCLKTSGPRFSSGPPTASLERTWPEIRGMFLKKLLFLLALSGLLAASASVAQMRPGAKVEKTYGLGLPRDMDKLIPPDSDYPVYPLKSGQEAYADVDGYRIKDELKKFTAI